MTGTATLASPDEPAICGVVDAIDAGGAVLTRFRVLPFGDPIPARDGRVFRLKDAAHAEKVLAATRQFLGGTDMMVDYDHQSELAATAGVGGRAPAAGWIKPDTLSIGEDGIYVQVDWNADAEAEIAARKYRYISPNFRVSKQTREVTRLVNIGLTNSPNLEVPALAHQERVEPAGEEPDMKTITLTAASVVALCAALAIKPEDIDEAKILAGVDKLKTDKDGSEAALASVRTELKLADDADTETVLAAVKTSAAAGSPDPEKFVPKAGYDELASRLKVIEDERILASVDRAVESGKLAPSMKQWAIDLGKKDEAALNSYLQSAPTIVGAGSKIEGDGKPAKGVLTDEEREICAAMGIGEADYLKSRDGTEEENA